MNSQVLSGIRVVDVTMFAFVPVAGGVLSHWGADVIKVEDPKACDPCRLLWEEPSNQVELTCPSKIAIGERGRRDRPLHVRRPKCPLPAGGGGQRVPDQLSACNP